MKHNTAITELQDLRNLRPARRAPTCLTGTRRGASLIELLLVIGVLVVGVWLLSSVLTGTGGKEGAIDRAQRQVQMIDMRNVHQGFYVWAQDNREMYPSTRTVTDMQDDVTHEVFRVLLEDGVIAGPQLMSPNEFVSGYEVGSARDFGPNNTSFALQDYDADDWLRYDHWGQMGSPRMLLMSDRWITDSEVPSSMRNLQSDEDNPGYWNILLNDGSTQQIDNEPLYNGSDHIFEYDASLRDLDNLMVHD